MIKTLDNNLGAKLSWQSVRLLTGWPQVRILLFPLLELRPMGGRLSYTQLTQVQFLQLRSCFSGVMGAQLFRNQQAVGSNPTRSFLCKYRVIGNAPLCQADLRVQSRLPGLRFAPVGSYVVHRTTRPQNTNSEVIFLVNIYYMKYIHEMEV